MLFVFYSFYSTQNMNKIIFNDNELIFDSWDGMTKELFDKGIIYKSEIVEFYNTHKRGN